MASDLSSIARPAKETCIALGFFDGVHLGHQQIIRAAFNKAREYNLLSMVFTFCTHPIEVLNPGLCFPYLTNCREKEQLARSFGIDLYICVPFTKTFSRMDPESFFESILRDKLRGRIFVTGRDYKFGHRSSGNTTTLQNLVRRHGGRVDIVDDFNLDGEKVGSTRIREAILSGHIECANRCLGRWYSIHGEVRQGRKIGTKIGIPTANLDIPDDKLIPRTGVYCVMASIEGEFYQGIGHLGDKPTFNDHFYNLEIHLFNFIGNLYGRNIRVYFIRFVRETVKYENIPLMMEQIHKDIEKCKHCFKELDREAIIKNTILQTTV